MRRWLQVYKVRNAERGDYRVAHFRIVEENDKGERREMEGAVKVGDSILISEPTNHGTTDT